MASFGTLALLLAFGLLAGSDGNYVFDAIRASHPNSRLAALVLILALVGAGSKAGVVPLHAWLPLAHPAAPSHVSALMSGVMTKVAVYGFIRIVFDLIGEPDWWWSIVVLAVGGITAVMGVLYALMQSDLKRVLAYSTIENIGIIFAALGLALAFKAEGLALASALALTAGLFHVFNHSLFKSLLFFGAGAVLNATGERDMEHLGGLIHRMPQTAFVFLVGSVAISALPPLNGFVSEWLTFQAILLSPQLPSWGLKLLVPTVGALLALSAALAAACFVRAFGITFLGRARAKAASRAQETDGNSLAAMYVLAALCLIAGICAGVLHRCSEAGDAGASRCQHAASGGSCNGYRSCRSPKAAAPIMACWSLFSSFCPARSPRLRSTGWRQTNCAAGRPGIAAIPMHGHRRNTPRRVSPSRSGVCSARTVFRAREIGEMPPPGSTAPARLDGRNPRPDLGVALRADLRSRRVRCGTSQCSAIPHHPPLSDASSSQRWSFCCWCWRYRHDPRSRLAGSGDVAGAASCTAAHRLCAQGESPAAQAARAAVAAALSRSRAPAAQGGGARATMHPGSSASSPTLCSQAPGSRHR